LEKIRGGLETATGVQPGVGSYESRISIREKLQKLGGGTSGKIWLNCRRWNAVAFAAGLIKLQSGMEKAGEINSPAFF